eukprot:TRINITY_DN14268_c0_g1_i1.p2 TRINITY_DN14268_c0_g1~~TRINITY_DN14268_c0_g1_i1.p2  ORF type:complete len:157 (+),score=9.24 TRINITY_DN14268_c0_g1_i1:318-788(+)
MLLMYAFVRIEGERQSWVCASNVPACVRCAVFEAVVVGELERVESWIHAVSFKIVRVCCTSRQLTHLKVGYLQVCVCCQQRPCALLRVIRVLCASCAAVSLCVLLLTGQRNASQRTLVAAQTALLLASSVTWIARCAHFRSCGQSEFFQDDRSKAA